MSVTKLYSNLIELTLSPHAQQPQHQNKKKRDSEGGDFKEPGFAACLLSFRHLSTGLSDLLPSDLLLLHHFKLSFFTAARLAGYTAECRVLSQMIVQTIQTIRDAGQDVDTL